MDITIRPESSDDHDSVCRVTLDAFTGSEFGHNGETQLVELLRTNCADALSLVALEGETLVGHAFFTPVTLKTRVGDQIGMGLAPLSVATSHQRRGIGTSLVNAGLAQIDKQGCPFTVVLGHPEYCARFGFVQAGRVGVHHGFVGMPQDVFLIRLHGEVSDERIANGTAFYRQEFGPQSVVID